MKKFLITGLIFGLALQPLAASAAGKTTPGQTNIAPKGTTPEQYLILPLPRGDLRSIDADHTLIDGAVKDKEGKNIGTVENLIVDTKTGKIAYAVIELSDTDRLVPVPWSSLKVNRSSGKVWLNGTADDLRPEITQKLVEDHSPPMATLMKEVEHVRKSADADRSGLGVTNRPASAGTMGEAKTGGGGPSGPRGMPPGKAPGFEGAAK